MEIYNLLGQQLPEYLKGEYPVFCEFINEYYRWLVSRQLGNLENITDIDFLSRSVSIINETRELDTWIGYTIVGESSGARATVLAYDTESGQLIIKYITKDREFTVGEQVHLRCDTSNQESKDTGIIDSVNTIPSVFMEHFQKLLDTYSLFGKDSPHIAQILKNIKDLYLAKGTAPALQYLLKASLSVDSSVRYPWEEVLKASESKWKQETAVTFKTIQGEIPPNGFTTVRFMNVSPTVEYKDYSVNRTEFLVTKDHVRMYFLSNPEPYENQIVEFLDNETIVWAGVVVRGIGGIQVVNGGIGWQVGQVFKIGGKDSWYVNSYSYDQPFRPWWKRNFDNSNNDYGESGGETILQAKENETWCKVTVVGDNGEMKFAEIIQLGEHMEPSEFESNRYVVNSLFFRVGEEWEGEFDAQVRFVPNTFLTLKGQWTTTDSLLSYQDTRLQDSYYYQKFSYDIISTVNSEYYQNLANAIHPAGKKMFSTYLLGADLDLRNSLGVSVSIPFVDISLFDIALAVDSIYKFFTKELSDTAIGVEFLWRDIVKTWFDCIITCDLKIKIDMIKSLHDSAITTEMISRIFERGFNDSVNINDTSYSRDIDKNSLVDFALTAESKFNLETMKSLVGDSVQTDTGTPNPPTYQIMSYDTNTDPYYERVYGENKENLSYGPVGAEWELVIK